MLLFNTFSLNYSYQINTVWTNLSYSTTPKEAKVCWKLIATKLVIESRVKSKITKKQQLPNFIKKSHRLWLWNFENFLLGKDCLLWIKFKSRSTTSKKFMFTFTTFKLNLQKLGENTHRTFQKNRNYKSKEWNYKSLETKTLLPTKFQKQW